MVMIKRRLQMMQTVQFFFSFFKTVILHDYSLDNIRTVSNFWTTQYKIFYCYFE